MAAKEEYEGEFDIELQFLESERKEEEEVLGNLMDPKYDWAKYVDTYEEHLRDIETTQASIRELDNEILKLKSKMKVCPTCKGQPGERTCIDCAGTGRLPLRTVR